MKKNTLFQPIFFIGVPRSGTTIIFESFARHSKLGWLSNYSRMFPKWPSLNLICRLLNNKYIQATGRKKQYSSTLFVNHFLPRPDEAYDFWDMYSGVNFSKNYLLQCEITKKNKQRLANAANKILFGQRKDRFSAKITGPSRIRFLQTVFNDGIFIHIIRDGRSVVHSLSKVSFWKNGEGLSAPWWSGGLPEDYTNQWIKSNKDPYVLAALQWKCIVQIAKKESKLIPPDKYVEIKYEDFIDAPHKILSHIFKFCNLEDSKKAHDYLEKNPILNNLKYKYKFEWDHAKLRMITETMEPVLSELGYT